MRSYILAGLALAVASGAAFGQRPERLDEALREQYGKDVKTEIVGTPSTVNGVRTYNVRIDGPEGESRAVVTEYGDFMLSGVPREFSGLPESVRNVQSLFRGKARDAEAFVADGYYIDVEPARGQTYRLRFDPVGRLRDVANPDEVERFETTNFEKADERMTRKIEDLARPHVPEDAKLRDVYVDPRFAGFYVAKFHGKTGEILVITDEAGNIYQTRTEIPRGELPAPVRDSFTRMFDERQLRYAYRTRYEFFTFQQEGPGGEPVTFRVRPNGAIMDVRGLEADAAREDEAVTAQFREGEQPRNDRSQRDEQRKEDREERRPPRVPGQPPVGPQPR